MPGGNSTGPEGQGPKTGRGRGYCGGNQARGSETTGRRGRGRRGRGGGGRGQGGHGLRNMFRATELTGWQRVVADAQTGGEPVVPSPKSTFANQTEQEESSMLKAQAADIFRSLTDIQNRLAELESLDAKGPPADTADE